ncbi:acyl-CoA dehydratase activase [Clostridium senegalense]|uniref:3-hydroxyacyl-ACP dehydratase n=1 Tax=Clostridium senegalense TaxID=1465809 RepID=A0A6M0H318_9CLOT|nr:acyl-CoA dehydratase activase [Clostridium senegalense]NEU05136.1 3-hydroxyacyl-ACP dehydratase [Clostridium senegalense]
MIGYVCKYTPKEIFEGFDMHCTELNSSVNDFETAHTVGHNNLCSYSKAIMENIKLLKIKEIVFMNCCDSLRRTKDILDKDKKVEFCYIIDLPKKINEYSINLFKDELLKFIKAYEDFSKKDFNIEKFKNQFKEVKAKDEDDSCVTILGNRLSKEDENYIKKISSLNVRNCTCSQTENFYLKIKNISKLDEIIYLYSKEILNKNPCMRMENIEKRKNLLKEPNIKGIIYNTVKFCDYYNFEYVDIKEKVDVPIVKIETDYTKSCHGQISTRIEGLMESMHIKKEEVSEKKIKSDIYVCGIDSGSTSTNAVILNEKKEILGETILKTGAKSLNSINMALEDVLKNANLKKSQLSFIVATGYGRISVPFADEKVTEITCHGKGANFLNKNIRTVIDIGGQDSKAIRINSNGDVEEFVMNDKCAAGTGRFLELMARTLDLDLNYMSEVGVKWNKELTISSMCSVFAESEVIALIAQNENIEDIVHSINKSVACKVLSLVKRIGLNDLFMITGGVSKNYGVVLAIEEKLNSKLIVPKEAQICGAIGAALIGLERVLN